MDRLSVKVLKYIASRQDTVPKSDVIDLFGKISSKSLSFLEDEGFIKSGRALYGINPGMKPVYVSDNHFTVTSKGLSFLEEKPGKDFDRWLTRFCAIWGAITGTVAIIAEIWLHFL